jgi:hypothetical protein
VSDISGKIHKLIFAADFTLNSKELLTFIHLLHNNKNIEAIFDHNDFSIEEKLKQFLYSSYKPIYSDVDLQYFIELFNLDIEDEKHNIEIKLPQFLKYIDSWQNLDRVGNSKNPLVGFTDSGLQDCKARNIIHNIIKAKTSEVEKIHFNSIEKISDSTINYLFKIFPNLKSVDIRAPNQQFVDLKIINELQKRDVDIDFELQIKNPSKIELKILSQIKNIKKLDLTIDSVKNIGLLKKIFKHVEKEGELKITIDIANLSNSKHKSIYEALSDSGNEIFELTYYCLIDGGKHKKIIKKDKYGYIVEDELQEFISAPSNFQHIQSAEHVFLNSPQKKDIAANEALDLNKKTHEAVIIEKKMHEDILVEAENETIIQHHQVFVEDNAITLTTNNQYVENYPHWLNFDKVLPELKQVLALRNNESDNKVKILKLEYNELTMQTIQQIKTKIISELPICKKLFEITINANTASCSIIKILTSNLKEIKDFEFQLNLTNLTETKLTQLKTLYNIVKNQDGSYKVNVKSPIIKKVDLSFTETDIDDVTEDYNTEVEPVYENIQCFIKHGYIPTSCASEAGNSLIGYYYNETSV